MILSSPGALLFGSSEITLDAELCLFGSHRVGCQLSGLRGSVVVGCGGCLNSSSSLEVVLSVVLNMLA